MDTEIAKFLEEGIYNKYDSKLFNNEPDELEKLFDNLSSYIGNGIFFLVCLINSYLYISESKKNI